MLKKGAEKWGLKIALCGYNEKKKKKKQHNWLKFGPWMKTIEYSKCLKVNHSQYYFFVFLEKLNYFFFYQTIK